MSSNWATYNNLISSLSAFSTSYAGATLRIHSTSTLMTVALPV